ncbi:peptide ABC transporter permease [Cellvibrio zantedeschiae]|uniref:Peptide ABC transporter permease n=1 Tax=Cellvibrio zantedeschiae TaxID=1237077 RepID=A0ABQ3AZ96_9GAMM|nr:peptide ABC transporter permease [Cellvibrio zantedeschiae]
MVTIVTFILIHSAPGGPFDQERKVSPDVLKHLNARYHLDEPVWQQFGRYVGNLLQGDFGPSFKYPSHTVNDLIAAGFPVTFELAFYAILFALLIGLSAGIIASLKPNTYLDYIPMSSAMLGICLPSFVLGPLLLLVFGIWLQWFPVAGWGKIPGDKILPSITLGASYAAYIARITRGGMLDVLLQDYIRTARAKGLSTARILFVHALRGGITPAVSFLGPAIAGLLAGSFIVESVFQIPGIGRFYIQAAFNRDYTMIMGCTIFFAFLIVIFNLLADVILLLLNPKLRQEVIGGR